MFEGLDQCCCAFSKAYIDSALKVYPCFYSANADTCFGDLKIQSLRAAWQGTVLENLRGQARTAALCGVPSFGEKLPHRYDQMGENSI
ncbi:SPASM domain-containing protein [Tropicibacter sp. R15_0]|uniref:SPASM domain-containing protein n=1 Tax=Tropicibacter sp. R15_0 TaxID=2821101 RepID=UPI001ADA74CA|nr:SPASM domain-containing protein [Tropicibacter sp. R15_0]MBO9468453.1 SPASM domain-containing protein [Tropicibacter sp. R15_0]